MNTEQARDSSSGSVAVEDVIRLAMDQAWDEGLECEHCKGSGTVPGGRRLIHSILGFIGADWDAEEVIDAVRRADRVQWQGDDRTQHQLVVEVDGRVYQFAVKREIGRRVETVTVGSGVL
jgi:hypothetical protein